MLVQIIAQTEVPLIGNIETMGIVSILSLLMLFFMRLYFSKLREFEDCLKEKALPPPPSPPIEDEKKDPNSLA
jgi:hypothetical protein